VCGAFFTPPFRARSAEAWLGGFLADFGGAKTNRHLFRAGAPRPTARGHESSSGRPQRAIIGKSAAYFGAAAPPKSARNPPHARAAHSGQDLQAGVVMLGGFFASSLCFLWRRLR
jgi:hypothetical protein